MLEVMSMFGTPIAQSVAGAASAERVASRDVRKRQIDDAEKRKAVTDSAEFNAETTGGVDPAGAGKHDQRQRQQREPYKPAKPKPGPQDEPPRVDLAG